MSHDPQSPTDAADFDDENPDDFDECDEGFECAIYWTGIDWHCPLAGSEECDLECTETLGERPDEHEETRDMTHTLTPEAIALLDAAVATGAIEAEMDDPTKGGSKGWMARSANATYALHDAALDYARSLEPKEPK